MDENGQRSAPTLILWLMGIAFVFVFIIFVMIWQSGIFAPSSAPAKNSSAAQRDR